MRKRVILNRIPVVSIKIAPNVSMFEREKEKKNHMIIK
jgi:hypothetical protein